MNLFLISRKTAGVRETFFFVCYSATKREEMTELAALPAARWAALLVWSSRLLHRHRLFYLIRLSFKLSGASSGSNLDEDVQTLQGRTLAFLLNLGLYEAWI